MNGLLWILLIYAVGITIVYAMQTIRKKLDVNAKHLLNESDMKSISFDKKIEIIKKITDIEHSIIPWYERSLSTIGIVAFLAMLTATAMQAVTTTGATAKLERLQLEVESLEEKREIAEQVIEAVTRTILNEYRLSGYLGSAEKTILEYRANILGQITNLSSSEFEELYNLTMVLGDFNKAIKLIEENIRLLDVTSAADVMTLAEYYYLSGSKEAAISLLDQLQKEKTSLGIPWQVRYIILRAVFNPMVDEYALELSSLLRISLTEAHEMLLKEKDRWELAASKLKNRSREK